MGTELPKATIEEMRKLRTLAQLGDYADTHDMSDVWDQIPEAGIGDAS